MPNPDFKPGNGPTVEYRKKLRVMISKTVMGFNVVLLQFTVTQNGMFDCLNQNY